MQPALVSTMPLEMRVQLGEVQSHLHDAANSIGKINFEEKPLLKPKYRDLIRILTLNIALIQRDLDQPEKEK